MSVRDRIDAAILAHLQNNARLSNKELAARVDLAPSSCLERVRRLEREGVLRGYHADVAPTALGVQLQAMIAVRLHQEHSDEVTTFRAHARRLPECLTLYHMAGKNDFLLHVGVRDSSHLREIALDQVMSRPEVAHVETAVIFGFDRSDGIPDLRVTESQL